MKKSTTQSVSISVNIPEDMGARMRELSYHERISLSSIVEIAISDMFKKYQKEPELAQYLHKNGASRRRPS